MASRTLSQLKERIAGEDAAGALNWFRVDSVLEAPNITTYTKYYAMQVGPPPPPLPPRLPLPLARKKSRRPCRLALKLARSHGTDSRGGDQISMEVAASRAGARSSSNPDSRNAVIRTRTHLGDVTECVLGVGSPA